MPIEERATTHTGGGTLGALDSNRKISARFSAFLPQAKILRRVA